LLNVAVTQKCVKKWTIILKNLI